MTTLLFSLISAGLFGLSYRLIFKRRLAVRDRNELFIKRRKNRSLGLSLLFPATLSLILAVVGYFFSDFFPAKPVNKAALAALHPADASSTSSAAAAPPATTASSPPASAPASSTPKDAAAETASVAPTQDLDAALSKLDATLKANPNDAAAYVSRGNIHASMKAWDLAGNDYRSALKINANFAVAAFNLAEMDFHLTKYDSARAGFVSLESDPKLGDLASYKAFLCDLFSGHDGVAEKELAAFNKAGSGAPYYFANLASCLYHKKPADAQDWLMSAVNIYPQEKVDLYTSSLKDLGYLSFQPNQ